MMPRVLIRGLIAASLVWGVAPLASAQPSIDALVGQPVVELRVASRGAPWNDPQTSALLVIGLGKPLSMADVRETIVHLMGLGRSRMSGCRRRRPGGVRVDLDLVPLRTSGAWCSRAVSIAGRRPAGGRGRSVRPAPQEGGLWMCPHARNCSPIGVCGRRSSPGRR